MDWNRFLFVAQDNATVWMGRSIVASLSGTCLAAVAMAAGSQSAGVVSCRPD
jgi:hypothetical protein